MLVAFPRREGMFPKPGASSPLAGSEAIADLAVLLCVRRAVGLQLDQLLVDIAGAFELARRLAGVTSGLNATPYIL